MSPNSKQPQPFPNSKQLQPSDLRLFNYIYFLVLWEPQQLIRLGLQKNFCLIARQGILNPNPLSSRSLKQIPNLSSFSLRKYYPIRLPRRMFQKYQSPFGTLILPLLGFALFLFNFWSCYIGPQTPQNRQIGSQIPQNHQNHQIGSYIPQRYPNYCQNLLTYFRILGNDLPNFSNDYWNLFSYSPIPKKAPKSHYFFRQFAMFILLMFAMFILLMSATFVLWECARIVLWL